MAKYTKKPITIEAFDFDIVKQDNKGNNLFNGFDGKEGKYYINTLEGKYFISKGDFVIIGITGEKYPCKRQIFFDSYDKEVDKS